VARTSGSKHRGLKQYKEGGLADPNFVCVRCWDQLPDLLAPFSAAGLEPGEMHFGGTIFRLPFRTPAQALIGFLSSLSL
jgi:hypothetical protein